MGEGKNHEGGCATLRSTDLLVASSPNIWKPSCVAVLCVCVCARVSYACICAYGCPAFSAGFSAECCLTCSAYLPFMDFQHKNGKWLIKPCSGGLYLLPYRPQPCSFAGWGGRWCLRYAVFIHLNKSWKLGFSSQSSIGTQ